MWLYRVTGALAAGPALLAPVARGRFGGRWADRLGWTLCGGGAPLWIHGASVGEAQSALAVLSALEELGPDRPKVLSVGTPAGLQAAQARLWPGEPIFDLQFPNLPQGLAAPSLSAAPGAPEGDPGAAGRAGLPAAPRNVQLMAPPLDFWGAPGRCLDRLAPRALVIVETEIWPELIVQCGRRRIPAMIVSGRISERSMGRYLKIRGLIGPVLSSLALVSAISKADRDRFLALGADEAATVVTGSPKFDPLIAEARAALASGAGLGSDPPAAGAAETGPGGFGPPPSGPPGPPVPPPPVPPLIVCGSTHPGEDEIILRAASTLLPGRARLILAPRHTVRAASVLDLAKSFGLSAGTLPASGPAPDPASLPAVSVVDRLGLLSDLYARAAVCLVGGSLVEGLSGHNPLEPAAKARPMVFGPHMSSFGREAEELVEAGAARQVAPAALAATLAELLSDPAAAARAGRAGLEVLAARRPVAPILARLIAGQLARAGARSAGRAERAGPGS
jgi:3-deoxy-D-manno-octulosonic-acid transferase